MRAALITALILSVGTGTAFAQTTSATGPTGTSPSRSTTGITPTAPAPSSTITPPSGATSGAAQSPPVSSPPAYPPLPNSSPQLGHTRPDIDKDNLAECYRTWDRGTHMTRQEWARTCHWTLNRFKNRLDLPAEGFSDQSQQRPQRSVKSK
jgi:hypothetical protein